MDTTETASKEARHNGYNLRAALRYARRNWPLVPLYEIQNGQCACGNCECNSPGKHPRINWKTEAKADLKAIEAWLRQWRDMNMGIVTGEASGIFVIDVDGAEGENSLSRLISDNGQLPDTLTAKTGRGRHLYFKYPGRRVKPTAGVLGKNLDVRGDGAYIIVPPSVHLNGARYRWIDDTVEIAEAPQWLIALVCGDVTPQPPAEPTRDGEIEEGRRNQTLFEHACRMRAAGASHEEIEKVILQLNQQSCNPPLNAAEVKQIWASAAKYPAGSALKASAITGDPSRLKWFPLDTSAWRRNHNVFCMRDYQVGWYIWLTVECWDRGGYLPNDPVTLAKLARASSIKRFRNEMAVVLAEFDVTDDETTLIHPALRDEYDDRTRKVEKKREAGLKRWAQPTKAEPGVKAE